jgi:uncharacterized membrane protein YphA (DoxX/SURF4 family)
MRTTLSLMGRMMFGGYFVYNAINHFQNRQMMAGYAASKGVPAESAEAAVVGSGALLLVGGLSVASGVKPRTGLAAIVSFLIPVSLQMHRFWTVDDPAQRTAEQVNFLKNMALVGAALALLGVKEPWRFSLPIGRERDAGTTRVSYPRFTERTLRALPA